MCRPALALLLLPLLACGDATGSREPAARGFLPPVEGSPRTGNVFDHELPFWAADTNGYLRTWWGERVAGIDGHDGYDFVVPEGTPVRAATDGVVTAARAESPWTCPLLGRTVSGLFVRVRHELENGTYETLSLHLSRIDVTLGERVAAGQQLGLSGNTGCSSGPHLHFEVRRLRDDGSGGAVVDPYGWDAAAGEDPWAVHPDGARSTALWRAGAAPPLYSEVRWTLGSLPVGIVRVRWMGVRDSVSPSNEFVEVERPATGAPVDLTGWRLRTQAGASWAFPAGTVLDGTRRTLRVYSGAAGEAGSLGMGMPRGVIDNMGDCIVLQAPWGAAWTYMVRRSTCTFAAASLLRADAAAPREPIPDPRDVRNVAATP